MSGEGREELRDAIADAVAQTFTDTETWNIWTIADALLPIVADELRAAALMFEADGEIVSAFADQARAQFDLASEAAYAITASDFQHVAGRLRKRADALCGLRTGAEGETGAAVTPQDGSGAYRANQGEV